MSKFLSGFKSLYTAASNAVTGVDQSVPEVIKAERLAKCQTCPKLIKSLMQCGSCYCFVNAKTSLRQEKCPEGNWDAWTDSNTNTSTEE